MGIGNPCRQSETVIIVTSDVLPGTLLTTRLRTRLGLARQKTEQETKQDMSKNDNRLFSDEVR